ncbi:MAG TPA: TolC family protein [Blastocatellia bacterium]|nr:TolC family protein [Blastocatellia bacterium]
MRMPKTSSLLLPLAFLSLLSVVAPAQGRQPLNLSFEQAVELALKNYPAIRAAQAQRQSAEAGVDLARANYLPRVDMAWQQNRATRNNVFGLLLPQAGIPSISGPQLDNSSLESAWGSAGSLLLSWEPLDFGLRKANVELARAIGRQAGANEAVTKLDVSAAAADAFLTLLATDQTLEAAQAGVERAETLARAVRTLVANQLRPGVDASRAEAELASARNHLIQAEQNVELARADLAEAIGEAGTDITIEPGPLLELPPAPPLLSVNLALHPLAIAQTAAVSTSRAREKLLAHSYFPRFNWQTAIFGRGTGAKLDGTFDNGRGLYPNTFNWATGLSISFPAFDIFGLRAKRRAETNNTAAEEARYDQVINTLKTQEARARTLVESARRIAENMQVQVRAAQETMTRAKTRYEFGLADITEMADAQRLLAQAEIDDSVAKIAVWRAMLAAAKLQGDLKPLLQQASGRK